MRILDHIKRFVRDGKLSCEDVNAFLADYVDENLDEQTRIRFEAHVRNCPNCALFLKQYRCTIEFARESSDDEVPDDVVQRTLDFLDEHLDDES